MLWPENGYNEQVRISRHAWLWRVTDMPTTRRNMLRLEYHVNKPKYKEHSLKVAIRPAPLCLCFAYLTCEPEYTTAKMRLITKSVVTVSAII